jgi:hypothetical protein
MQYKSVDRNVKVIEEVFGLQNLAIINPSATPKPPEKKTEKDKEIHP